MHKGADCGNYPVFWGDMWSGDVFVFEECRAQDAGCARGSGPESPALIVFEGCPEDKCFLTVLCICAAGMWAIVDEGLHADGDKRMLVVVVMAVNMGKGQDARI